MSTAIERLQQTIQALRSRLADERGVYLFYKKKLEVFYPEEWKIVGPAIVAVAQYYHGEIVRAKHDLADWMNGHEMHGTYGDSDAVEEIHTTLKELLPLLENVTSTGSRYTEMSGDPLEAGTAKMDEENAKGEAGAALDMIKDMHKALEEIAYGER